jgi:hypothetical protein
MGDITRTKADVRPLPGAIIQRGTAGATIEAGEAVYLNGTSNWAPADGNAGSNAEKARGVAVAPKDIVSGDVFDICVFGPVEGYASMTPGAVHYVSDTVGEISTAAGTNSHMIGWARSATVLFVQPQLA